MKHINLFVDLFKSILATLIVEYLLIVVVMKTSQVQEIMVDYNLKNPKFILVILLFILFIFISSISIYIILRKKRVQIYREAYLKIINSVIILNSTIFFTLGVIVYINLFIFPNFQINSDIFLTFVISIPIITFIVFFRNIKNFIISVYEITDVIEFQPSKIQFLFIRLIICLLITLLIIFILPQNMLIARLIGPISILISFFIVLQILLTLFILKVKNKFIFSGVFILLITISSRFNDNHRIRTITNTEVGEVNLNRTSYYENFKERYSNQNTTQDSVTQIYFVAAEGGGSRSMAYTTMTLNSLYYLNPKIANNIFCASGVSGGSVGIAIFYALYSDNNFNALENDSIFFSLITGDHLSPLLSSFLFTEGINSIIPASIPYFDRSRWLEDSWSLDYKKLVGQSTLDSGLLFFKFKTGNKTPNFIFNSCIAETGQKAVTTNLDYQDNKYFNAVDIVDSINGDIPLKTCASLSSRFPYITPSALLKCPNSIELNIVDGGYLENTGIASCIEIIMYLQSQIQKDKLLWNGRKFNFNIIFIKNSNYTEPQFNTANQIKAPIAAFYSAWGASNSFYYKQLPNLLSNNRINLFTIQLDRQDTIINNHKIIKNNDLTLGWYLNQYSKTRLSIENDQLRNLFLASEYNFIINAKLTSTNTLDWKKLKSSGVDSLSVIDALTKKIDSLNFYRSEIDRQNESNILRLLQADSR